MNREVMDLNEKEVQTLIADFPWLLNLDYEIIPGLKDKGMEYRLSHGKRADLILRDRRSGRPVIVEFKAVPFYRENIGQILEYRARMLTEFTDEDSLLNEIFEEKLYSPILILIVPHCSAEARLACNLAGIEVYEYEDEVAEFIIPEKQIVLKDFIQTINRGDLPFFNERPEIINDIYIDIKVLLDDLELFDYWKSYRKPSGEYNKDLNHMFINKILFEKEDISIGIFENIFSDNVSDTITIEYIAEEEETMLNFREAYIENDLKPTCTYEVDSDDDYNGYYLRFELSKKEFIDDVQEFLRPIVMNYLEIMKNDLELMD